MTYRNRHVILGTDWWTDCDDVAAVRLVCRFAKERKWQLDGIILNACMPYSAPSLEAFLRHEGITCPIGIDPDAVDFGRNPPYQKNMAETLGGTLRNEQCEDGVSLYRRLLAAAEDGTSELLEIGYPQVLAALLTSSPDDISPLSGAELVRKKVKHLWMMAGNWEKDGHGKENNFARNTRSSHGAHTVLALCPVDITFLGFEVGVSVFAHPKPDEDDPLYRAFRDHGSEKGRCAWDPMLILLALSDDPAAAGYDTVRGLASVDADTGENFFDHSPENPVRCDRYVIKHMPDAWYEEQMDPLLMP